MADNQKASGKKKLNFFAETKAELKKATWPTKKQLLHNTGIILVFIAVVTVILSVLDIGFSKIFEYITNLL